MQIDDLKDIEFHEIEGKIIASVANQKNITISQAIIEYLSTDMADVLKRYCLDNDLESLKSEEKAIIQRFSSELL